MLPEINNPVVVIIVAVALTFLVMTMVGLGAAAVILPRYKLKKRLDIIGVVGNKNTHINKAEGRRQKRIQDKIKQLKSRDDKRGYIEEMRTQILQAGLQVEIKSFLLASGLVGLVTALIALVVGLPAWISVPAFLIGAILLPKLYLKLKAGKRQKVFTQNFADAIDVVVRGIRSGLPVGECLSIVGREFPGPVGEEFRQIVEGQNLGLTIEDIMRRGLERMPTPEFKFFSIVLQIQKQTGGNLADTLANLSSVLRDRKKMRDKVKALSSEAKASAMIIASLPFFVMGMLSIINPDYLGLLFTDPIGQYLLGGGAVWGLTGVAVMAKMINFEM